MVYDLALREAGMASFVRCTRHKTQEVFYINFDIVSSITRKEEYTVVKFQDAEEGSMTISDMPEAIVLALKSPA
jgi:hypothetical protein